MTTNSPHEQAQRAFWSYSLATYARDGIEDLCLRLQDDHGFDVNLLLICLWIAETRQMVVGSTELAGLRAAIAPWMADVVEPLRRIRRRIKNPLAYQLTPEVSEPCRGIVKTAELEGERIVQLLLMRTLRVDETAQKPSAREAAAESLAGYAALIDEPGAAEPLAQLVEAVFP
ncbi:MAG: hypothetical protein JWN69_1771 [Alphaproteobacteria bacterium]|nr:hypothetical protein [Alphaproteobacteria bacterium]